MKKWVRIRTKNGSAAPLRRSMLCDDWAVVRLGSVTPTEDIFPRHHRECIEINTPEAVRNSSSKLRMKRCFATNKNVVQAEGFITRDGKEFFPINQGLCEGMLPIGELPYPLVLKRVFGCQGRGMKLIENEKVLKKWLKANPDRSGWIFEKFHNYAREYRLHVARGQGVIMSWRKLRTREATERWFFNNTNSNWVGPGHELFNKPKSWRKMVKAAIGALESTGLDIGAVDIRVQSSNKKDPKFIVCEINSAPALGDIGIEEYKKAIVKLIDTKKHERDNM